MRRLLVFLALTALGVVALAGCGSSSSGSSSALNTELSYFPANSPFVLSIATDPNSSAVKRAQQLVARFPIATFGESALKVRLQQLGINYESDVRPLFGNPVMFGATSVGFSAAASTASSNFLFVWVTKDAGKLQALVKKLSGGHTAGKSGSATLYDVGGAAIAVDGATAVFAPSGAEVQSALDRHVHGGGFSSTDYTRDLSGLPKDSLVQAFGNLTQALSSPSAAKARRVPWVAALRGYGTTVSASSSGLSFQFHLDTTGGSLTPSQLPFAAGTAPPRLLAVIPGGPPITAGIYDPSQIVAFAEAAEQAASPISYAKFQRRQATVRAKTGVDLNTLASELTGDLIIASDTHTTMGRAAVSNGPHAAQTLSKLISVPGSVFPNATSVSKLPGGFYAIKERGHTITVGVVGSQLLVGNASPQRLTNFAVAPTAPSSGAQGSLAFRVGLSQLLGLTLKQAPPKVVQTILSSLGDITGWSAASTSGITGSATLGVQ